MYYVTRSNKKGDHGDLSIVGAWSSQQHVFQEEVPNDNLDLEAYLNSTPLSQRLLAIGVTVDDIAKLGACNGMFVTRDKDGQIVGAWATRQHDGQEMSPYGAGDLQDFLTWEKNAQSIGAGG